MKHDRSYVGDCQQCRAKVVDCCDDCDKCVDCCNCDTDAEITVDALFAQADYYEGVIKGDAP